ncbi:hypothetical protein BDQ17DRAFT_1328388 [Cyathus striatus]|nr:hypothetical protein BDQ17DRAFT_1328388 [Cyathus striatus]
MPPLFDIPDCIRELHDRETDHLPAPVFVIERGPHCIYPRNASSPQSNTVTQPLPYFPHSNAKTRLRLAKCHLALGDATASSALRAFCSFELPNVQAKQLDRKVKNVEMLYGNFRQLRKRVKDVERLEEDENVTFKAAKWRKLGGCIWWAEEVWGVRLTRAMYSLRGTRRRYPSGRDEEASNLVVEAKSSEPPQRERYAVVETMYGSGMGVMGSMGSMSPLDLTELFGHFRSHRVRAATMHKKFNVTKALISPVRQER